MEEPTSPEFHCPSCGKLSEVQGGVGEILCSGCGYEFRKPVRVAPRGALGRLDGGGGKFVQRDVVSRRRVEVREQVVVPAEPVPVDEGIIESGEDPHRREEVMEDGTRKVTKRKKTKKRNPRRTTLLVLIWAAVVIAGALSVQEYIRRGHVPTQEDEKERLVRERVAKESQVQALIAEHSEECRKVLNGFLSASNTAGKAQYVRDPIRVTPRMATYYNAHLFRRPGAGMVLERQGLKIMSGEPGIEMLWRAADGEYMEVVFVSEKGRWVIDWEEFVRYSKVPWHRFLSGGEVREGEFRLYIRRQQLLSEKDGLLGVQFYPPDDDAQKRVRGQSPQVLVRLNSENGQQLQRLWEEDAEEPEIGRSMLEERDSEQLKRVRVALRWEQEADGKDYLKLEKVLARNWWGEGFVDDSGEEPAAVEEGEAEPTVEDPQPEPPEEEGGRSLPEPSAIQARNDLPVA